MRRALSMLLLGFGSVIRADVVPLIDYHQLEIPITPFSNMASGYQATNPGFRAILRSPGGAFIAGGPLTMDAVMKGYSDDATKGSAYGRLILRVDMVEAYPSVTSGIMSGTYKGKLSICMAEDVKADIEHTQCKKLGGNIHPERPFQWIDKQVDYVVEDRVVKIVKYYGRVGEGGTSQQLSLAVYHPAYGFAAPGKAFKDYQSPIVLDLNGNGKLDLVNVWDETPAIRFDLNGTGQKVRTGWVKAGDGLLFWDNGSGCAKNGTQFFGEYTESKDGHRTFSNGFEALKAKLETDGSGEIRTKAHPKLKIWQDKNQDGVCQKSEAFLASKVVKSISLDYKILRDVPLNEDNEVRIIGKFIGVDGKHHLIGDVWFKQRRNDRG